MLPDLVFSISTVNTILTFFIWIYYSSRNNNTYRATVELFYAETQRCFCVEGQSEKLQWYHLLLGFRAYLTVFKLSFISFVHLTVNPFPINTESCFDDSLCSLDQIVFAVLLAQGKWSSLCFNFAVL